MSLSDDQSLAIARAWAKVNAKNEHNVAIPAPKDPPEDATEAQRVCILGYTLLYLYDLIDCLDLETSYQVQQCMLAAYGVYCDRYDSCLKV